jgi:hypothetical protein
MANSPIIWGPGAAVSLEQGGLVIGGADGGNPAATVLRGNSASGSNVAGADIQIQPSNGTGSAGSGNITFATAPGSIPQVNQSSIVQIAASTTATLSTTVNSSANRLLLCHFSYNSATATISSVLFGATPLTQLSSVSSSSGTAQIWYLLNPSSAANSVVATFSTAVTGVMSVSNLYAVNQSTPLGTPSTATGTSTAASVAPVTTGTTQKVFDTLCDTGQLPTITGGQTALQNVAAAGNVVYLAVSTKTGAAGTTTMSYSLPSSAAWAIIAVAVNGLSSATQLDGMIEAMRVTPAGSVGMGTTAPVGLLANTSTNTMDSTYGTGIATSGLAWGAGADGYVATLVNSGTTSNANGLFVSTASVASTNRIAEFDSGGAVRFYARADGNIGIGTAGPMAPLHIIGNSYNELALQAQQIISSNTAYNASPMAGIDFQNKYDSSGDFAGMGGIGVAKENATNADVAGYLSLFTRPSGGGVTERFRVTSAGNVGVGTTAPGAALDVTGAAGGSNSALLPPRDTTANRPTTPVNGMIRYNSSINALEAYQNSSWSSLYPANTSKNYLGYINGTNNNGNFETGATTGWSLGTVGTLTNGLPTGTPTFGSGSSGSLSISAITSGQLSGATSLSYSSSSVTNAGDMLASPAVTLDSEDQAKVLTFKFYYKVVTPGGSVFAGNSTNSFGIAFYDVTNSVWLSQSGNFAMTQNSGVGIATGTLQTGATTASVRMVIYNLAATSGPLTLYYDDFSLSPQTAPVGPVMTDRTSYTPTFSAGLGTPTAINMWWKRVGDECRISGSFTTGTTTTGVATLTLPAGLNIDTTKIKSTAFGTSFGLAYRVLTSTGQNLTTGTSGIQLAGIYNGTANVIQFAFETGSALYSSDNANTVFNSSELVNIQEFVVPIAGWSSNVQSSSDTDTRVISFCGTMNATQSVTADTTNIATQVTVKDTAGGWSGSVYTVPVSGDYQCEICTGDAGAGSERIDVYVNGTLSRSLFVAASGNLTAGGALLGGLSAGATISFRSHTTTTLSATGSISIFRLSGPAVIAATESVNCRVYSSSTTVSGTLATVVYSTKAWDTHNAYSLSTGIYTAPVSGKYQVNASIAMTGTFILNSTLDLQVQQTGANTQTSESKSFAGGAVTQMNANVGDIFYMLAGDQIKVQASNSGTSPVIAATTTQNWLSIARVGN